MSSLSRAGAAVLAGVLGAAVFAVPDRAAAFCGFYVAGADSKLYNNATVVVLMRGGTRTVLAMQNNYEGPPEQFAMVVPVPVVLKKSDVKTLEPELFARVDALTAPRLVEYWERDPCDPALQGYGTGYGSGSGAGFGGLGDGPGPAVRVEAEFAVGEYEIVILGADDAVALEGWLTDHKYVIPAGAAEQLRPYVAGGSKFFVAKVDPKKVKFDAKGKAMLSPLRVVYPSEDFRLPIRLGLINAKGTQDLIVHILGDERYEVANYPNVTLPTEVLVKEEVREQFPRFYTALFDELLARSPRAVVTEYAWDARGCDPCPTEPLSSKELASLGMDALYDGVESLGIPNIKLAKPTVTGDYDKESLVRRIVQAHVNELRYCFNNMVKGTPGHGGGAAQVDFTINLLGRTEAVTWAKGPTNSGVDACMMNAVKRWVFPKPQGPVQVQMPFAMTRDGKSGGELRSFVLTRLHARYDASTLGEDLVFRGAPAIANGSGGPNGPFVQTPVASPINRFQGRYIIRHPWKDELKCEKPVREVWSGPPGEGKQEKVAAVENAAFAPREKLDVAALAAAPIVALGGVEVPAPAAEPVVAPSRPAESPVKFEASEPAAVSVCGCRESGGGALWAVIVVPLLQRRRR